MARRSSRMAILSRAGFFLAEARELSHTSTEGMKAPYFRRMILSRRGLFMAAKRHGWSMSRYRDYVRQQYLDRNAIKIDKLGRARIDVWKMLRYYEEIIPIPDEYESPWRKRAGRKLQVRRQAKRTTRKQMLSDWIKDLNRSIENARSESRKEQLSIQRNSLQRQLDRLQ